MSVQNSNPTQLRLALSPIDPAFKGTPQQFAEEFVRKTRIVAPFGTGLFVISSTKPTSNVGPWLKDGKEWWVWDDVLKDYVPVTLDVNQTQQFYIQDGTPPTNEANQKYVWFQTLAGNVINVWVLIAGVWKPLLTSSGPTTSRPTNPRDFQEYYDTTISVLLWWERGAWRTKDGNIGDVKQVFWETGEEALARNPGWEILGTGTSGSEPMRARALGQATKDAAGSSPTVPTALTAGGLTTREARSVGGGESGSVTLTVDNLPRHRHEITPEDTGVAEGTTAFDDPSSTGWWDASGADFRWQPANDNDVVGYTRYYGKASPDAVVVPTITPTLFLWTLVKL